jgi:hypothetical protein
MFVSSCDGVGHPTVQTVQQLVDPGTTITVAATSTDNSGRVYNHHRNRNGNSNGDSNRNVNVKKQPAPTALVRVLEDNAALAERIRSTITVPLKQFHSFTTSAGVQIEYSSLCPAGHGLVNTHLCCGT